MRTGVERRIGEVEGVKGWIMRVTEVAGERCGDGGGRQWQAEAGSRRLGWRLIRADGRVGAAGQLASDEDRGIKA